MKNKIVGIFICMLVMITVFSVSNTAIDTATATITESHQDGIQIDFISGGFGITARIRNTGTPSASVACTNFKTGKCMLSA
jgi:hypothetical protein